MASKHSSRSDEILFRGTWQITSTDVWGDDALGDLGPPILSFGPGRRGELRFLAITASVDYRVATRDGEPIAEFSWEGDDDGQRISGRGWARAIPRGLAGRILIHEGDESDFVAKRLAKARG